MKYKQELMAGREKTMTRRQNEEIKALRAEVDAMKELRNVSEKQVEAMEKDEKKESRKMALDTENEEERETKDQSSLEESARLIQLKKLMIETLKLQSAPKVEIDSFTRDPLEFNYFMETFKNVVENLITDPSHKGVLSQCPAIDNINNDRGNKTD